MINKALLSGMREVLIPEEKDNLNLSHWLFLLFWLFKPFYLWESGSMQISDFIFVISFGVWVIKNRGYIKIDGYNLFFAAFIGFTYLVNIIYMLVLSDTSYLISSVYYTYNFLVILIFSDFKKNMLFLKALLWVSTANLFIQLVMFLLGIGSFFWGNYRFMGSFNDPNQFSFSMFTSFLIVFILSQYFYNQHLNSYFAVSLGSLILALYFVIQGSSTGMLLGFFVFILFLVLSIINLQKTPVFIFLKFLGIILLISIIVLVTVVGFSGPEFDASPNSSGFLIKRLLEKFDTLESNGLPGLLKDRGMDKIIEFPKYLVFGAGEGNYIDRFLGTTNHEVHSTFPGIVFAYGLIPFIILCTWIWHHLKGINMILVPVYIALLIESLTLANQRQPAFWIIFMLGSLSYIDRTEHRRFRLTRKIS